MSLRMISWVLLVIPALCMREPNAVEKSDLKEPVAVIERSGERERTTAGAVAIHQLGETLWVVVGDWCNANMDF